MTDSVLITTELPLPLASRGKVRDTYDLDERLLIVTTDRISAFDVILPDGIPDKGLVLNQLSAFWFGHTRRLVKNHLVAMLDNLSLLNDYRPHPGFTFPAYLVGRSMLVKKAERLPVECVVRGYLAGSAWEEYQKSGALSGLPLPRGLVESQALPEPLFTPTTKADTGHDEPLSFNEMKKLTGDKLAEAMRDKTLAIYREARKYALKRGIIIADTKLEFGLVNGELTLIDELLTPDSSRFWDTARYQVGKSQPSYDKQPVRDWLAASGWNKEPPAPALPPEVIRDTTRRYRHAYEVLAGKKLG
ncbi:MAG: phosphoribosylaminoimidazolesuccinocarboxamide synthase [Chloroflexota bacterium]